MPRLNLETLARELDIDQVPTGAKLTAQAWAGDEPYTEVDGPKVIFSPAREVTFRDGQPTRDVYLDPTAGKFCWRLEVETRSGMLLLPARFVEVDDVPEVTFGTLQQVDPATFLPVPDVIAGWDSTRVEVLGARDETVAAAADIRDRTMTATVDPDDPDVLILTFPAYMLHPDGTSILIPVEVTP